MKVVVKDFYYLKKVLPYYEEKYAGRGPDYICPMLSVSTGVPVIAVYMMYEDLYGQSEETQRAIKNLIKFYGYTEIIK